MSRIFISYSRKDRDFMERLQDSLTKSSFSTWVDVRNILGGRAWKSEINIALEDCKAMILIISPEAMKSEYVKIEWEFFINNKKALIPVLWKSTEIPHPICDIQYIDFRSLNNYDASFEKLSHDLEQHEIYANVHSNIRIKRKKTGNLWWLCHDILELYRWHVQNLSKEWIDVGFRQCLHHARELELDDDILEGLGQLRNETEAILQSEWGDVQRQHYAAQVRDMFNIIAQRVQAADPDFDPGPG
jgi:TIR domain-containing protein